MVLRNNAPKAKSMTLVPAGVQPLFGSPPLLPGEDAAGYDELVSHFCAAVKPIDFIEEMLVADAVFWQWNVQRWRRVKLGVTRTSVQKALESELSSELLELDDYCNDFEDTLANILQIKFPEDQARDLAHRCAWLEPDAYKQVKEFLEATKFDLDRIQQMAKTAKAEELAKAYAQCKPAAIRKVSKLLASNGQTIDEVMAFALLNENPLDGPTDCLATIERIDRLIAAAELRRDAILREIDRRRAALGEAMRRSLQQAEPAEFTVIEKVPGNGENAA